MNTITRRTALAGAAAMPLLPASALAAPVTLLPASAFAAPANATDAAWAAYQAAKARYDADKAARDAVEAATGIYVGISDDALDAFCEPICNAERAILSTKATTLTDVERKLAVVSGWNGANDIPAELVDGILADVRAINGAMSRAVLAKSTGCFSSRATRN